MNIKPVIAKKSSKVFIDTVPGDITEDELDLSQFGNTFEDNSYTPVDFTPHSTFDQSTSAWLNDNVSLDYSTLNIEFMAENEGRTPKVQD